MIYFGVRIPEKLRDRMKAHLDRTGVKVGFWVAQAITEKLDKEGAKK